MFEITILPSAQADLEAGFWFYEAQEERLGAYFIDCLTSDIESLRLFAGIHAKPLAGFHRTLSKRFPFAIYYDVDESSAVVVACSTAGKIQHRSVRAWPRCRAFRTCWTKPSFHVPMIHAARNCAGTA